MHVRIAHRSKMRIAVQAIGDEIKADHCCYERAKYPNEDGLTNCTHLAQPMNSLNSVVVTASRTSYKPPNFRCQPPSLLSFHKVAIRFDIIG